MVGAYVHLILTMRTIPLRENVYLTRNSIHPRKALPQEEEHLAPGFMRFYFKLKAVRTTDWTEHVMTTIGIAHVYHGEGGAV